MLHNHQCGTIAKYCLRKKEQNLQEDPFIAVLVDNGSGYAKEFQLIFCVIPFLHKPKPPNIRLKTLFKRRGCPCAADRIDCYRTAWDDGCPRLYRLSYRHSRSVMDGRNSSLQIAVGPARDPGWRVQGRRLSRCWLGLRADPQPD